MTTRGVKPPKFERNGEGTIRWPSVEIELTPELVEMSRRVWAARRAWSAVYDRTLGTPGAWRALGEASGELARVLCEVRWEIHRIVGAHFRTFWVDAAGENETRSWFPGAQFVSSDRFHWFIDGERFSYEIKGERFSYPRR
jgi:hypothetical protein